MSSYTWKITDASIVKQMKNAEQKASWKSPIFTMHGFRWYLKAWPNGFDKAGYVDFAVFLAFLPPKIQSVAVSLKYSLLETNTNYEITDTFKEGDMICGWPEKVLQTSNFQKYNQFTFSISIELLCVYDEDDNDITHKYLQNDESKTEPVASSQDQQLNAAKLDSIIMRMDEFSARMDKMQQQMNDMQLRMDEEQKNNDHDRIDKIMKEMQIMKQNMNKISLNNNVNPEQQKLKVWLTNNVKLPQYYDIFIKNGIDELSVVALIDKDTLKEMGIDTIGHQMKILNKAKQLKQNNNNNNNNKAYNEGGPTAYI